MKITSLAIPGPRRIIPRRIGDERGYFAETFRADLFAQECGDVAFVQSNESLSARVGTIRGLHFQSDPFAQGKLVRCTAGALLDVIVDIRRESPTYGRWIAEELSAVNGHQLWVPVGFAHGFCTLEPDTVISYNVTSYYNASSDKGLRWDDPAIGVAWPDVAQPETLSAKDKVQPLLADLPSYFHWQE